MDVRGLTNSPGEWNGSLVLGCSQESSESTLSRSTLLWFSCSKDTLNCLFLWITHIYIKDRITQACLYTTCVSCWQSNYLFSRLPFPESLKPLAKGLLSIFSCVIYIEGGKLIWESVNAKVRQQIKCNISSHKTHNVDLMKAPFSTPTNARLMFF